MLGTSSVDTPEWGKLGQMRSGEPYQTRAFPLSLLRRSSRSAKYVVKGLALHYAQAMSFSSLREWVTRSTAGLTPTPSSSAHGEAHFLKGLNFASGQGVAQDYVQAAQCYIEAAELGHSGAQLNLATLYEHGRGVGGKPGLPALSSSSYPGGSLTP